ncbi:MAG: hypothetical protein QM533_02300 [Cytophagales bacterium]|nr:hypothetical protein [Cytophagales bacterium]
MSLSRSQFLSTLLVLMTFGVTGCVAGQSSAPPTDRQLTGVLTRRGAQIESWWGMRAEDGQLWRLEASNPQIERQLEQLRQQTVRVTGAATTGSALLNPVLRVREIVLVSPSL